MGGRRLHRRRDAGRESALMLPDDGMVFEDARVRIMLSPAFEVKGVELKGAFVGKLPLVIAAEMAVIPRGVAGLLPFVRAWHRDKSLGEQWRY